MFLAPYPPKRRSNGFAAPVIDAAWMPRNIPDIQDIC